MNWLLRLFGITDDREAVLRAERELAYLQLVTRLGRVHANVLHLPIGDKRTEGLIAAIDLDLIRAFDALKDLERNL